MNGHEYRGILMNIKDVLSIVGAFSAGLALLLISLNALVEGLKRHAPRDTISAALVLGFGTVAVWVTCIGVKKSGWHDISDNTFEWMRTVMAIPLVVAIPKLAISLVNAARSKEKRT